MHSKLWLKASLVIIILVVFSNLATAMAVSPGRATANFVPNAEFESSVCFSTDSFPIIKIEKIGDLANNIEIYDLPKDGIVDTRIQSSCFKYKVKLPDHYDLPGIHESGITAVEMPDQTYGTISAVVRLIHQIRIIVPYPGKYLETTLIPQNAAAGDEVQFMIYLNSKGVENISFARGEITITDYQGNTVGKVNTNIAQNILPNEQRQITAKWNSTPNKQGNYNAKALVTYDELNSNTTAPFKLGGLDVNLIDYSITSIIGGIRPFYVTVDSIWSEPINSVKAIVEITNKTDGTSLQKFETLTRTILPWGTETLQGYVDTEVLGLGEFNSKITILFENQTKVYEKTFKVVEVPKPELPKKTFSEQYLTTKNILITMGVLLTIVLIIVIIALLPKKKKESPTQPQQAQ